jgi:predicted nuclease with RNAse H fold
MVDIIGIDCASKPEKTGIALARYDGNTLEILDVFLGKANESIGQALLQKNLSSPTLLAIDAPLGWTLPMSQALAHHKAGGSLRHNLKSLRHNLKEKDRFFRRYTDEFTHHKVKKLPLEVGADRIARTAYSALMILDELRVKHRVEMLWNHTHLELIDMGVIEVYPAATLKQLNILSSNYKLKADIDKRRIILNELKGKYVFLNIDTFEDSLILNADLLDALICVLCAVDFYLGSTFPIPTEAIDIVKKEGWIWVRE